MLTVIDKGSTSLMRKLQENLHALVLAFCFEAAKPLQEGQGKEKHTKHTKYMDLQNADLMTPISSVLKELFSDAKIQEREGEQSYTRLEELLKLSHAENSNSSPQSSAHGRNVHVRRIPEIENAEEFTAFLEGAIGQGTVADCRFFSNINGRKLRGSALVEFTTEEAAKKACDLASFNRLCFMDTKLAVKPAHKKKKDPTYIRQANTTLAANSNLHVGCLESKDVLVELWRAENVKFKLDDFTKKLAIILHLSGKTYKLEWRLREIFDISPCKIKGRQNSQALLLKVWLAPQIFEKLPCATDVFFEDAPELFGEGTEVAWARTTDFSPEASIGQSFSYCIEMFEKHGKALETLMSKLSELREIPSVEKDLSIKHGISYSSSNMIVPLLSSPHVARLPFQLVFLLNSLVQHGYLSGPSLREKFIELIQPSAKMPLEHIIHLLSKLKMRQDTCYTPEKWFKTQTQRFSKKKSQVKSNKSWLNDGLVEIRRVYVTPSRVYFLGPEAVVSNRVTRYFIDSIDNFLRVSFVEEDFDRASSSALMFLKKSSPWGSLSSLQKQHTKVYERIISILRDGISIGSKRFEFLAFSSSQLRENSVWMFASDGKNSADDIREWMGNFLDIRNVAKCAARMGQSFSSSTKSLNVYPDEVEDIPDIWDIRSVYCFSDGIGKISERFATEVAKKCKLKRLCSGTPSLYQIRYGGYKGVVAVDPSSTYKLSLRDSMNKFPSIQVGLDIINWSHLIPSYLNRQIITLLSTLGVKDAVFERMQLKVMQRLDQMLDDGEVALDILQTFCGGDIHRVMVEMISAGYGPGLEPFLKRMLYAFRVVQLMHLRKKTRIFVPKGRLLMGCLDETAALSYGEVFVSVLPTPGTPHKIFSDGLSPVAVRGVNGTTQNVCIVEGKIIVAKNPCVHPGDVRVLTAVDVPALHHLVDCIVFPQQGPRPHPSECSGSDLDGDLYFVSWDEELIPSAVDPPMDYEPPPIKLQDHPVTIQEIEEYFVDFMTNDSLGLISNAHTVFADTELTKARDRKCLMLAKLISTAVDFPKTGAPAILPTNLRPKAYPDFLEKSDKTTYKSERVLGKLYRSVIEDNDDKKISPFSKEEAARCYDKELEIHGFEHYLEEAYALKCYYDEKLLALMYQYDVKSEAEIFTGDILSLSRLYQKRPGEVKERIQRSMHSLKREARSWLRSHEESMNDDHDDVSPVFSHEELAKASAWYHVTYHPYYVVESNAYEDFEHEHLLSFPWVVHDKLLAIKKMHKL